MVFWGQKPVDKTKLEQIIIQKTGTAQNNRNIHKCVHIIMPQRLFACNNRDLLIFLG